MKPIRERNPVVVGLIGIALLTAFALLAYFSGSLPLIGGGTTYRAQFTEAAGLRADDEVRVAGVRVGKVTGVRLAGDQVEVSFKVRDAWVGDASTAAIKISTVLGAKYLAVDPIGAREQDPATPIPISRTAAPYDVIEAFSELAATAEQLDTKRLANSFEALSDAFRDTPPEVSAALEGMSALSETISSRDAELARLLANTRDITATLADQNDRVEALLRDGNLLMAELRQRRDAIGALLEGTRRLAVQLSGLVEDNQEQLAPMLRALDRVTDVLQRNQDHLNRALALAGPYNRLVNNTLGNGRWLDTYVCGLVPEAYAPQAVPPNGCIPPKPGGSR